MDYSDNCVALTKDSEGFRSTLYRDPIGIATIGYGHRVRPGEDFSAGLTEAEVEALLHSDLEIACAAVNRHCHPPQGLWQGAVDALTDFVFNVGEGKFAGPPKPSTLLVELNAGNIFSASQQFERWIFSAGTKEPGLVLRRKRERDLFLSDFPTMPSSDVPMLGDLKSEQQ